MRLFVLLFLLTTFLSGASFDDEWPLYVYGDSSYYKLILDGIAMIVQNDDFMDPALLFVALSSTLFVARGFYTQNISDVAWNVAAGIGFMTMLMYPNSTVHVLDVRTLHGYVQTDLNSSNPGYAGYTKTDNIPFYIAASASFATSIKYHIIDVATDALTPIDVVGGSFRNSGFATPMTLAEDMITTSSFKHSKDDQYKVPIFGQALSHYTEKCIIENALYTNQKKIHGIRDPKMNQLEAMKPSNFDNFDVIGIVDLEGQNKTCTQFWNENISSKIAEVKNEMIANLENKNPDIPISPMAKSVTFVAGLESDTTEAFADMQEAMVNIATTSVIMNAFSKAGTGLSGIDLSNEMTAQQSLFANMTDSTGQFKWMIRVVPVLEFLIFGILLFLAIPMAFVAGISGAQRGGKMLMNYTFGLIAFSFVDVALAVVQAISLFYYKNKMADTVIALGGHPYTASGITPYLQEMAYMSGMMGLAAVIVVPITVGVVFKGETAAAMGAYNSVMGKYKGDQGGQNALDSSKRAAAIHTSQAQQEQQAMEDAARRELAGGYSITSVPKGILASQYLDQISAEAAALSGSAGAMRVANSAYGGDFQKFAQDRARAGMGRGITNTTAELGSTRDLELSNTNENLSIENQIKSARGNAEVDLRKKVASGLGAAARFAKGDGDNFSYQVQTDSEASIASQAAKGKFSKDHKDYDRDEQVKAAMVTANDGLVKSVQTAKGLVDSMAFNSDGSKGDSKEFGEYAKGISNQSRIATNKVMGAGKEDLTHDDMADVKRTEQANVKALIAKGDALQKSFGSNLDGSLNGQSYDTMIRAQEGGQFSSSTKAIKAAGGEDGFIALQRDTSSMKTGQSMASVKANKDAGFLDNDGNVTALGKKAFAITPGEQANALVGKMNLAKKSQKIVDEVADAAYDAELANSGDKFAANIAANKAIAPFLDGKGNALTGQAFWNKQAELKSGSFSGSNSMMFGDGQVFSGGISLDGKVSGKLSSGLSTSQDNTISLSNGYSIKENLYNPETRASQQSLERAEHALDPKKAAAKIMAAGGKKASELNQFLNENGIPTGLTNEQAFAGGEGAMYAAATAVGGAMLNQTPKLFGAKRSLYEMFDDLSSGRKNAEATHKSSDETKPNNNSESGKPNHSDTPNSDKDSVSKNTKSSKSGGGSFRKQAGLFIGSSLFGYAATTEANETPTSQGQAEELLKTSSDLVSNAELTVGAGTMAAVGTSKIGLGGAAAAKLGARVTPGLGIAYGAIDGAYRTSQGDYLGAAMSGAIGAASTVPVFGTALAVGGTFAQMATDAFGITGGSNQPPAPQHQGFTTLPMGHNTLGAMEQHFTATQQQNAQAMSNISPTSRYVGFSATDADGSQVNFSTSKQTRNLTVDGYDTGMPAQQFSGMMQSPDAVNQFATAISQTSFSGNQEAYASTTNILMDMNAQNQRANTQTKARTNSIAMSQGMKQDEFMAALLKKDEKKDDEF